MEITALLAEQDAIEDERLWRLGTILDFKTQARLRGTQFAPFYCALAAIAQGHSLAPDNLQGNFRQLALWSPRFGYNVDKAFKNISRNSMDRPSNLLISKRGLTPTPDGNSRERMVLEAMDPRVVTAVLCLASRQPLKAQAPPRLIQTGQVGRGGSVHLLSTRAGRCARRPRSSCWPPSSPALPATLSFSTLHREPTVKANGNYSICRCT